ncbi:MAG: hypothetical protein BHW58_07695 [Azospirillum sp. 51_20]|nr:MAG: hypothetical protein BHW58_07695 [Azospirillum sp. 51_20]DAZ18833.1 MAG TPA: hypothetical protein [Caudoviricetes sp.]
MSVILNLRQDHPYKIKNRFQKFSKKRIRLKLKEKYLYQYNCLLYKKNQKRKFGQKAPVETIKTW